MTNLKFQSKVLVTVAILTLNLQISITNAESFDQIPNQNPIQNQTQIPNQIPNQFPELIADSAILIETQSGRVIFEKDADTPRMPASTTKTLTCIIGLEQLFPEELVPISENAAYTEDTTFPWNPGDQIQAQKLVLGTMLVSDNGGAVAIAEKIGGNVSNFSRIMNEKAISLDCTRSNFVNPNGLPDPNHYTTARDMSKISAYAMKNPIFRSIVSTQLANVDWLTWQNNQLVPTTLECYNTNAMLETYPGCNGVKTGWTSAAGGCLVASAKRGELELLAVVLHSENGETRFQDATKLLDYGFNTVQIFHALDHNRVERKVSVKDGSKSKIRVGLERDVDYVLIAGETVNDYEFIYDLPKQIDAPVSIGDHVGDLIVKLHGIEIDRIPFRSLESVEQELSWTSRLISFISSLLPSGLNALAVTFK